MVHHATRSADSAPWARGIPTHLVNCLQTLYRRVDRTLPVSPVCLVSTACSCNCLCLLYPTDSIGPAERWHWEDAGEGRMALRSVLSGKYLNVDPYAQTPALCARGLTVRQWEFMWWGEVAWL